MDSRKGRSVVAVLGRVLLIGVLGVWGTLPVNAMADGCSCYFWDRLAYDDSLDACVFCYTSGADCGCGSTCQDDLEGAFYGACIAEPE